MKAITCRADLESLPIWIVFDQVSQPNGKKPKKIPYIPGTNRKALVNDPSTCRTYDEALADWKRTGRLPGYRLEPAMDLTLVDTDNGHDPELIEAIDSLTEDSINGGGHIVCRGQPPANFTTPPGVEVYPRNGARFVLPTWQYVGGRDRIEERSAILAELFPPAPPATLPPTATLTMADDELLAKAFAAANGAELKGLLAGDLNGHSDDHSAADLATASKLAFWTQDAAQIERIISGSTLGDRDKWKNRPDYRKRTIAKALQRSSFYTPPAPKITRERGKIVIAGGDPCSPVRDELAELRAENAALKRQLAERDATITALTQTILNPHLTHTEKVAAVSIARHADAKRAGGQVEPDGRVVLSPSEVADDWRPKPEPGEHIAPVNPDSGTAPHMPRSSARSVLDAALERDLVQGEKRGTIRNRKDGSTYKDWEYVVSPATSFADLLNPWASWRPDQPKQRKVRESRACPHCKEVHPITRVDYCGGCGGELSRQTIEQPDAGENISPIRSVAKERHGRKTFSDEPTWLSDAPDPWDTPPQPALFPLDDAPPGQSHHFSAD